MTTDLHAVDLGDPATEFIISFADDEHLMGQQHTEWIGVAPFLEEDLAFSSIAQDELGHAALLYALLVGDTDEAIDAVAFGRPAPQWRSSPLVECTLADWGDTLVRHWLYDEFEALRWGLLAESSVTEWRDVAERAAGEERFHRRHGDALLDVFLNNTETRERLTTSLDALLPLAFTMFDATAGERALVTTGTLTSTVADLVGPWKAAVEARFGTVNWPDAPAATSRTERHGDFAALHSRINEVLALERDATW